MTAKPETDRVLVVVSHTHWDREWYLPFEAFRARLVGMMDSLLNLLDTDPGYKHFVLDGQTVPLDDYLEIRPERHPDIERLVREGRLLVGPNYMLPDEFLIGGEAWIHNLMYGIRSARKYGGAMLVGYSPDAFGHIAHLPAILRGFGIDSVLIWRGVGPEATTSEFRWAAPDGSEVLAIHFPFGYGMMPVLPDNNADALASSLKSIRNALEPLATTKYVLVPNGTDHLPAHTGLSQVISRANEQMDGAQMVHGTYPMFIDRVRSELDGRLQDLPLLEGEFRSSARSNVLAGVLSTRIWLKQRYQHCEDLLARYADPLAAWAHILRQTTAVDEDRTASTRGLLRHAWTLLLQNGPHDSVTGCSVDEVYVDVGARFDRCEQIANEIIHQSFRQLADAAAPKDEMTIVVFNPEHGPRSDFCTARLPVDGDKLPSAVVAPDGKELPTQIVERGGYSPVDSRERVTVGFVARDVPGHGYTTYRALYNETATHNGRPTSAQIENDVFSVTADPTDGTLSVHDKRSGRTHTGLNRFVDGGDSGDEYTYCPPDEDSLVVAPDSPAQIRITESGPARHTLEITLRYKLPSSAADDHKRRSDDPVDCEITTLVSLYPGIARIDIETGVNNRAKDHRLRVHFPTGLQSEVSHAEQHFGVVERSIAVPEDDGTWFETPVGTYPQKSFVDVSDGTSGLMVANRGLPEYEALQNDDGTITVALTLLRCVGWLSRTRLRTRKTQAGPPMKAPGAQMEGRWTFGYSLVPHEDGWESADAEAHRFLRPLRSIRTSRGTGSLPPSGSLLEIDQPEMILSTVKLAEDDNSVVVRLYNIANAPVEGRVHLHAPASRTERVNLNEEEPSETAASDGWAPLSLERNEIATLKYNSPFRSS